MPEDDEFLDWYIESGLHYFGSYKECLEKFKHINEVMEHYGRERT